MKTLTVDVRVIAATNKHLEQEITRGAFRQDLFYRLNVIPFYVPALRDRMEDIPRWQDISCVNSVRLTERKRASWVTPRWKSSSVIPGREMSANCENLVERLVIVCPQARIEPHHLPPELFRGAAESPHHPYSTLHEARSAYEREFILRKLQENRWNMTQTPRLLAWSAATSTAR